MANKADFIQEMQDLVVDLIEASTESTLDDRENLDVMVRGIADRTFDEIATPGANSTDKDVFTNTLFTLQALEANSLVFTYVTVFEMFPVVTAYIDDTGAGAWRAAGADIRIEPVNSLSIRILNSTASDILPGRVKLTVVG